MSGQTSQCPQDGCHTVQIMSKRLEDAVEGATECLEKMTAANNSLMVTIARMEMTLIHQTDRLKEGSERFGRMETAMHVHSEEIAVIKSKAIAADNKAGASTAQATTISTLLAGATIAVIEWLRSH